MSALVAVPLPHDDAKRWAAIVDALTPVATGNTPVTSAAELTALFGALLGVASGDEALEHVAGLVALLSAPALPTPSPVASAAAFWHDTLPFVARLALELPTRVPSGSLLTLPPLTATATVDAPFAEVSIPASRAASLLAAGFFGLYPRGAAGGADRFGRLNLTDLWRCTLPYQQQKMLFHIHYFERLRKAHAATTAASAATPLSAAAAADERVICVRRHVIPATQWAAEFDLKTGSLAADPSPLLPLHHFYADATPIERGRFPVSASSSAASAAPVPAPPQWDVVFANKVVGGFAGGAAQEEIRTAQSPDLALAALVCARDLEPREAVTITGTQRVSRANGFMSTLKWAGDACATTTATAGDEDADAPDDASDRGVVAIDATEGVFFTAPAMAREVGKAFVGFSAPLGGATPSTTAASKPVTTASDGVDVKSAPSKASAVAAPAASVVIATGNWGCGMFGGPLRLKFALQWLSVSKAGRRIAYHSMRNAPAQDIPAFVDALLSTASPSAAATATAASPVPRTVGQLWTALRAYVALDGCSPSRGVPALDVFAHIRAHFGVAAAPVAAPTAVAAKPATPKAKA